MTLSYENIYKDVQNLIKKHETRDPKQILKERKVKLIAFNANTKLLGMYKIIKRNSFVFYNPYVDQRIQNMVFAHELGHDIYHKEVAKDLELLEYELFDINSEMEIEANIFAAHLLLDEKEILEDLKKGYNYQQMASLYNVNVNLMIFKLNEMQRLGLPIKSMGYADAKFFKNISPENFPKDTY